VVLINVLITGYVVCVQERSTSCNSGSYSYITGNERSRLPSTCTGMWSDCDKK